MNEHFAPLSVWEASYGDYVWAIYLLVERTPERYSGDQSSKLRDTWQVVVLYTDMSADKVPPGTFASRQLDDISFHPSGNEFGYDSYGNSYRRLA